MIIISSHAIDNDDIDDLEQFCRHNSQTRLALQMLEHKSSGKQKLFSMLQNFSHFDVELLRQLSLFENVVENLSQMLEGYGLTKTTTNADGKTILLTSVFLNENGRQLILDNDRGVIVVQTEQLCCSEWLTEDVFLTLQACEKAANCVILEYSDHNLRHMQEELQVSKSVVLLPIMLQGRLDEYYRRHHLPALWERSVDVAFFGTLTPHRQTILGQIIKNPNPTTPEWEMIVEQNHEPQKLVQTYLHSKICLTIHAFERYGPGEYHRLSELGVSGCLPVMQDFLDTIGMELYKLCGGVVFSSLAELPDTIAGILEQMEVDDEEDQDDSMRRRVEWWRARVNWSSILVEAFGSSSSKKKEQIEL